MTRVAATVSILGALLAGLVLGYFLGQRSEKKEDVVSSPPPAARNVVDLFRNAAREGGTAADAERQTCLREKLGAERYAAIVLNPRSLTPEEQFKILPCQQGAP